MPRKRTDEPTVLHTEQTRARVIEMYQAGHKLADITRETGVPRATVYWILDREGIKTNRTSRGKDDAVSLTEVLDSLRRSEQEVGRLTAELERERQINRWFMDRVVIAGDLPAELAGPARGPARPRRNNPTR